MLFGLKYVLQSPIYIFKSLYLHPVSSRDIGELKTDSETYRRNLCIHLHQLLSFLKDWTGQGKKESVQNELNSDSMSSDTKTCNNSF